MHTDAYPGMVTSPVALDVSDPVVIPFGRRTDLERAMRGGAGVELGQGSPRALPERKQSGVLPERKQSALLPHGEQGGVLPLGEQSKAPEAGPGVPPKVGRRAPAKRAALPPWPGRLPKPAPAVVLTQPMGVVVVDDAGEPVGVSARLELTGVPAGLLAERKPVVEIVGWAGPWPVEERWWAPDEMRRQARFQALLADGRALLLSLAGGHWAVEAIYD